MRKPAWTLVEHLERGIAKAIEIGDCLEWQGAFSCSRSTPIMKVRTSGNRHSDNISVCRTLWEQVNGPIPDGKLVYRKCCNNACVLLGHLRCGTRAEWKNNQMKQGLTKHKAATKLKMTVAARSRETVKYNMEKAREVRALKAERLTHKEISVVTGVSEGMVSDIVQGSAWKESISNPFFGLGA